MPDYSAAERFKQLGYPVSLRRVTGSAGQALLAQGRSIRDRVRAGDDRMVVGVWVLKMSTYKKAGEP